MRFIYALLLMLPMFLAVGVFLQSYKNAVLHRKPGVSAADVAMIPNLFNPDFFLPEGQRFQSRMQMAVIGAFVAGIPWLFALHLLLG